MGKNKKKKLATAEPAKPGDVTPWNALFRLPETQRYRVYGFLVWLLGMFVLLWVFRN
ncbi:MAG: hypothetical protein WBI10_05780 [Syntrophales bacterium]|jgi:hypothetical protein